MHFEHLAFLSYPIFLSFVSDLINPGAAQGSPVGQMLPQTGTARPSAR